MPAETPPPSPPADKAAPAPSLVAGLAVAAVLAYLLAGRRRVAIRSARRMDSPPAGSDVLRAVPNVGVEDLSPGTLAWLKLYAVAAAAEGIPVTVTSGKRDPYRQAAAMIAKVERGEDLHALYRDDDLIDELLNGPHTVNRWGSIIAGFAANGRPISNHLSGLAADIRSRDWTPQQLQRACALAIAMNARRAIIESDHLHLEIGKP
jgi:hypothetical protein